jgi:hypothetical protein
MPLDFPAIERLIEHRLQSVEMLIWALDLRSKWNEPPEVAILVEGKLQIEGTLSAITNPMLDAGFIHSRALLEFLGLCARGGRLSQIKSRKKPTDVGIEHFAGPGGRLQKLEPDLALSRYEGPRDEAERAFLRTFHFANEGLAHTTSTLEAEANDYLSVKIACRGIPALMTSYFYTPRGMRPPTSIIMSRLIPKPRSA